MKAITVVTAQCIIILKTDHIGDEGQSKDSESTMFCHSHFRDCTHACKNNKYSVKYEETFKESFTL